MSSQPTLKVVTHSLSWMRSSAVVFCHRKWKFNSHSLTSPGFSGHWNPQTLAPHWSHFKFHYFLSWMDRKRSSSCCLSEEEKQVFGAHSAVAASASPFCFSLKFSSTYQLPPKKELSHKIGNWKWQFLRISKNVTKNSKGRRSTAGSASRVLFVCHKLFPLHWWRAWQHLILY